MRCDTSFAKMHETSINLNVSFQDYSYDLTFGEEEGKCGKDGKGR
jgi:hypothetical protein